jgi:hypothetical protein
MLRLTTPIVLCAMVSAAIATADTGQTSRSTVHHAPDHPMRYHLALPSGWKPDRTWPVLVVIPDAARDFKDNLARFARARGDRPYILVAPEVLSCGGARTRTPDRYSYSPAEWTSLQAGDDFAFEDIELAAVLADVAKQWRGEPKAFLTGWEAAGHTVWAQALRHSERWRGVAPVTPNYQHRGLEAESFSKAPERETLAIQPFRCGTPKGEMAEHIPQLDAQIEAALRDAREHGFRPQPKRVVAGADHGPLPEAVFAWCDSLRGR